MFMSVQRSFRRSIQPHFAFCGATAFAWGASGAALALGAPACSDKANDTSSGESFEGGSSEASAINVATSDCTTCVAAECTGVWAVCLTGSRSPVAAYAAYAACTDARTCGACAMDCTNACTGGAANKPLTITSCVTTTATDEGNADAGDADAGDAGDAGTSTASVDACASCVADKCGDAKKLCALGTECSIFLGCANACADTSCVDGCGTVHSTGRASAIELSSCTLTSCRSACGL